jgi:selenium metabolism protein YedF
MGEVVGGTVVLLASERAGQGDDELGAVLMRSFVKTLAKAGDAPATVVFLNGGVRLACEGSPVLEELAAMAARGVELLACGTCLDFFGLKQALRVGRVSNMAEIVERLTHGDRVVRP